MSRLFRVLFTTFSILVMIGAASSISTSISANAGFTSSFSLKFIFHPNYELLEELLSQTFLSILVVRYSNFLGHLLDFWSRESSVALP